MSARKIAVAAVLGISTLAISGCVESGGYIASSGPYSGYHRSRTVVVEHDRDYRHDHNGKDWRRDHRSSDRDHRNSSRHDRDHHWSRSGRNDHCRDPRSRECRDHNRH